MRGRYGIWCLSGVYCGLHYYILKGQEGTDCYAFKEGGLNVLGGAEAALFVI